MPVRCILLLASSLPGAEVAIRSTSLQHLGCLNRALGANLSANYLEPAVGSCCAN